MTLATIVVLVLGVSLHTLNPVLKLIAFISIDLINLFPILNAHLQFAPLHLL
jgi:hypothetical protein